MLIKCASWYHLVSHAGLARDIKMQPQTKETLLNMVLQAMTQRVAQLVNHPDRIFQQIPDIYFEQAPNTQKISYQSSKIK